VTLSTHPSRSEVKNELELYILSPCLLHDGSGTALLYFNIRIRQKCQRCSCFFLHCYI